MTVVQALDFAAVFVFALTGGLAASRAQLDIVGFLFIGCLTGVGGGTVRDAILNREPVFWVGAPAYIGVACVGAVLVFLFAHRLESRARTILWLDALALSIAAPAGMAAARGLDASEPIVVIMGVVTGCMGGLMRDVVCNEAPLVLRQRELYVTAAFAGAVAGSLAFAADLPGGLALALSGLVTLVLRAGSLAFGWRLPAYRPRPPRR